MINPPSNESIHELTKLSNDLACLAKTFRTLFITLFAMFLILAVIGVFFEYQMRHIQYLADEAYYGPILVQKGAKHEH